MFIDLQTSFIKNLTKTFLGQLVLQATMSSGQGVVNSQLKKAAAGYGQVRNCISQNVIILLGYSLSWP